MLQSNQELQYEVKVLNFADSRLDKARVMVCQLDFDQLEHEKKGRLHFVINSTKNRNLLRRYLNIAVSKQVDLLVFPELTVPSEFVNELWNYSKQYNLYIIGGTHYKKSENGYFSVCPIVTPQGVYDTEKIFPSPYEQSSFNGGSNGAIPGHVVYRLNGTKLGDFAVVICLDYVNDGLRNSLGKDSLDFLIVSAFNGDTANFHYSMHLDVQHASDGLFVLYSNCISKHLSGDGKSALFGFMNDCYKSEYRDKGCTDGNPSNKIYEFSDDKTYCIFELDLEHKKPYVSKNCYTESNVKVIEEESAEMGERHRFAKMLGATESRYLFIDKYFVKPREYDEMLELLEKEGVLVITGDPGIGKTYTAIHFLYYYFGKGYHPTWSFGLAKEDRDKQREHLLNFEPQEKDIVYIEDPFGRTVFENREELKTLFGNMVQKFRASRAKLIITSRAEVYKQFEKEVLSGNYLEEFKKELNVRNPSYGKDELKEIAKLYIKDYTDWWNKVKYVRRVMAGIDNDELISPLMLFNLVRNHPKVTNASILDYGIKNARKTDLVSYFADEIKTLTIPARILLYLVLFYGRKNIALYREMFGKVQTALFLINPFEGSTFAFELRSQNEHRIQRLGVQIPVYRFSHPAYEEALIILFKSDATCHLIAETCLATIVKEDDNMTTDVFKRFISRYPILLEQMIKDLNLTDFSGFDEMEKLDLTRKMVLSGNVFFKQLARRIHPIEKVIESLYSEDGSSIFKLRLRALNRRKDEIGDTLIDWSQVFSVKRIIGLHPLQFLECYDLAVAVDEQLINKIKWNLQKIDVIRKFILLPTNVQREKFEKILCDTEFSGVYQDLKDKIPDEFMSVKINRHQYARLLRKYVLKKESPKGIVYVDYGALIAMRRGAKLYPVGVVDVEGNFQSGDIVYIVNTAIPRRMLSLVEMSSSEVLRYMGLHSQEIYEIEGGMVPIVISRSNFRE